MKRRIFLTALGAGGAILGISSFKFVSTSFEDAAVNLIKRELSFLTLDEEGVKRFVRDYAKTKNDSFRMAIRGYSFMGIDSGQSGKVNQLVSNFLLSSDFFQNGMDEKRTIRFVRLYSPYTMPCAHPFSHVNYPA